jgi:hypothetical protein
VEHKCPAVVEGYSSLEDCLPGCPYAEGLREHQYWEDKDQGMEWEANQRSPRTKEEILSKLPSGKHSKHIQDIITMSPGDWESKLLEEQDERDLNKMPYKDRKNY